MSTVVLHVPDISCEHCERAVTGALRPLPGVREVTVDIPGRTVTVAYDEDTAGVDRLRDALVEADYPVADPA